MLNNNLTKKRERLQQELREVSLEEQDKRLTGFRSDKSEVEKRMAELDQQTQGKEDAMAIHYCIIDEFEKKIFQLTLHCAVYVPI